MKRHALLDLALLKSYSTLTRYDGWALELVAWILYLLLILARLCHHAILATYRVLCIASRIDYFS